MKNNKGKVVEVVWKKKKKPLPSAGDKKMAEVDLKVCKDRNKGRKAEM